MFNRRFTNQDGKNMNLNMKDSYNATCAINM